MTHLPEPSPLRYGRIAHVYDRALTLLGIRRGVSRFLARVPLDLPPEPRILDAGCGSGLVSLALLRRFPVAEVVAFDLDQRMLAVLQRRARRAGIPPGSLRIAHGDLRRPQLLRCLETQQRFQLSPSSFDAVMVGAALEHVPLEQSLRSLHALLKPGGVLLDLAVRRGVTTLALALLYDFKAYSETQLREAFSAAGFPTLRLERLRPSDFPANVTRIGLLACKP